MSTIASTPMTAGEYLEIERKADHKSELIHGRMYAMAGASGPHTKIVGNLARFLGNRLDGRGCDIYPQDLRVKVSETGMYTYPDLSIVCGGSVFEDSKKDT